MPKMSSFLNENHRGSVALTSLNVLGVLGVLNVLNGLNVLNVLYVLYVLNMPMDASLACWALFFLSFLFFSSVCVSVCLSFFPIHFHTFPPYHFFQNPYIRITMKENWSVRPTDVSSI